MKRLIVPDYQIFQGRRCSALRPLEWFRAIVLELYKKRILKEIALEQRTHKNGTT